MNERISTDGSRFVLPIHPADSYLRAEFPSRVRESARGCAGVFAARTRGCVCSLLGDPASPDISFSTALASVFRFSPSTNNQRPRRLLVFRRSRTPGHKQRYDAETPDKSHRPLTPVYSNSAYNHVWWVRIEGRICQNCNAINGSKCRTSKKCLIRLLSTY